jgi:ribosomal protein S18 acetylase RimI-like enzyme
MLGDEPIEIRDAGPGDVESLVAAVKDLPLLVRYHVGAERLGADLRRALMGGEGLLCATRDGVPVGFAWFLTTGTFAGGGYLRLIAVTPHRQGGAVGTLLLDEVERRVSAQSRTLFLLVSDFNSRAQRFYLRRGYVDAGVLRGYVRPEIDERIYWKQLR